MQDISIYNAILGKKIEFRSLQPGVVRIYVCGMTVYDYCHIGHARVMVFFDVVTRFLRYSGYTVNYVRNITDIDDKIIAKAAAENCSYQDLTEKYINAMHADEKQLGNLSPDHEPKASESIDAILDLILKLVNKEHAYVKADGSVWFKAKSYDDYGKVSGQDIASLKANIRKNMSDTKDDNLDFVLWKPAKPGEPAWDSPWGKGRPGWHIECSAMASNYLGFTVDIHGGGIDLKFPHHENEAAQATCAFDAEYVKHWMHIGHVTNNTTKMSKSLGNFLTIRSALELASGESIRYMLLTSHYRKPLPFTEANLTQATKIITRFYRVLKAFPPTDKTKDAQSIADFMIAMRDDFNLIKVFTICFELMKKIYNCDEFDFACQLSAELRFILRTLGFAMAAPEQFLKNGLVLSEADVLQAIAKREQYRQAKDWAAADKVRDELRLDGVILEDCADGTTWYSG